MGNNKCMHRKISKFRNPKRIIKDNLEKELTRFAFNGSYEGTVLTLTGPAVERHVEIYQNYFPFIVIAEIDKSIANFLESQINIFRKKYSSHIKVHRGDVFDYEHPKRFPPIRLLDLDFTQGWTAKLENKVIELSNRHPQAWLRLTYNSRSPYYFDSISELREKTHEICYRAVEKGTGDPMVIAQFKPLQ